MIAQIPIELTGTRLRGTSVQASLRRFHRSPMECFRLANTRLMGHIKLYLFHEVFWDSDKRETIATEREYLNKGKKREEKVRRKCEEICEC